MPFTASDFGRTLTSNARGSDHAWGGNHFVMGGSVGGKKTNGQDPSLAVNPDSGPGANPLDTGRGRLIPTTSCDEYFAELALWLGVPPSSLHLVLPVRSGSCRDPCKVATLTSAAATGKVSGEFKPSHPSP